MEQTGRDFRAYGFSEGEAAMGSVCYDPETVEMMRKVLEDAWAALPESRRSTIPKTELAERILAAAATGERDPERLRMRALMRPNSAANILQAALARNG
jgi:hypothetical protein